jgi:hypothetical protein
MLKPKKKKKDEKLTTIAVDKTLYGEAKYYFYKYDMTLKELVHSSLKNFVEAVKLQEAEKSKES